MAACAFLLNVTMSAALITWVISRVNGECQVEGWVVTPVVNMAWPSMSSSTSSEHMALVFNIPTWSTSSSGEILPGGTDLPMSKKKEHRTAKWYLLACWLGVVLDSLNFKWLDTIVGLRSIFSTAALATGSATFVFGASSGPLPLSSNMQLLRRRTIIRDIQRWPDSSGVCQRGGEGRSSSRSRHTNMTASRFMSGLVEIMRRLNNLPVLELIRSPLSAHSSKGPCLGTAYVKTAPVPRRDSLLFVKPASQPCVKSTRYS